MTTDTGGTAFPQHPLETDVLLRNESAFQGGMTLLDYFAGQALSGFMANTTVDMHPKDMAECCYNTAAAMIAEKRRREGKA